MNSDKKDYTLFYKYQPINNHTKDNLRQSTFYFHNPCKHNDPFDSKICVYAECTEKQWVKRQVQASRKRGYEIEDKIAKDLLEHNIKEGKLKRNEKVITTEISNLDNAAPLACCFSKENNNILMWSHYADHHKGVCLNFKAKHGYKTESFRHATEYRLTVNSVQTPLYPIKYEKEKPKTIKLNDLNQAKNIELFMDFFLTKSPCWEYEKEYRLLSQDTENIKKFKKEEFEGIIFGLRVDYFDAYMIYKTIKKNYLDKDIPINFYKAREKETEYGVEISQIENIDEYLGALSDNI